MFKGFLIWLFLFTHLRSLIRFQKMLSRSFTLSIIDRRKNKQSGYVMYVVHLQFGKVQS